MNILSIESSADETAIAILTVKGTAKPKGKILAHTVASQIDLHTQYGGIFPMMAKREHGRNMFPLFVETLQKAGMYQLNKKPKIESEKKLKTILEREQDLSEIFFAEFAKHRSDRWPRTCSGTVGWD